MEKNATLYNLTQQLQGQIFVSAFRTHLDDEQRQAILERPAIMGIRRGYAESPAWMMVQVMEFDPEPLTVKLFRRRAVYSAPKLSLGLLELLASEGLLDRDGDGYFMTEAGKAYAEKSAQFSVMAFEGYIPVDSEKINALETLMRRVIDASLQVDETHGTWCLAHSRNRAPSADAPALAKIVQYGADFNAFRDDAHMAACAKHDVDGHIWEAFSQIRDEAATSANDLYANLAYRGFYTQDWQIALDSLTERSWLGKTDEGYHVTKAGQAVSDDIEAQTDAYFFAPWDVLSEQEFEQMVSLIEMVRDACQERLQAQAQ
ncbi:MAG: hypothetical protein AAFN11_10650 [Chloroflexota bacterium]